MPLRNNWMQNDATVGRVLLASLHQAISEVLPARLEFYESWLKPSELHKRTIGIASFMAVISFLRHEGDAYDVVNARAGQYAAVWCFEELPAVEQAFARALPHGLRVRLAFRLIDRMLRALYSVSHAIITWRGSTAFIELQGSPFCDVGRSADRPLCGFYASAIATFLRLLNLPAVVRVSRCRASGARSCLLLALTNRVHAVARLKTSSLGLMSHPSTDFTAQPSPRRQPVDQQPATPANPAVTVGGTQTQPDTVEITQMDAVEIEAQWATIAPAIPTAAERKADRRAAVMSATPIETERDPEAPWRRL